jgi:hypothetical protein
LQTKLLAKQPLPNFTAPILKAVKSVLQRPSLNPKQPLEPLLMHFAEVKLYLEIRDVYGETAVVAVIEEGTTAMTGGPVAATEEIIVEIETIEDAILTGTAMIEMDILIEEVVAMIGAMIEGTMAAAAVVVAVALTALGMVTTLLLIRTVVIMTEAIVAIMIVDRLMYIQGAVINITSLMCPVVILHMQLGCRLLGMNLLLLLRITASAVVVVVVHQRHDMFMERIDTREQKDHLARTTVPHIRRTIVIREGL